MSNLTQAKREAKRLFNIAKSNDNNLNIKSLNEAQKILAIINGYKDWYDFEVALHKKDAQIPYKEQQQVHKYLSDEDKYNLKRYYIDNPVFKKQIFAEHLFQHNPKSYERVWFNLGRNIEEQKKIFSKDKEVSFSPRNAAIWGKSSRHMSQFLIKQYMQSNACVRISYDTLGTVLYDNARLDAEQLNRVLFLNLKSNSNFSHTLDPINPFIPFKKEFLTSFGMIEKEKITDVFYALCLYYFEKKHALTSNELQSFLSLKWLVAFDEDIKIKNLILNYLLHLKLLPEDINDEYFFENKNQEIQMHHISVQQTQKILDLMHKLEKTGIFSPEAQIDFDDVFYTRKILFIHYPPYDSNAHDFNKISNIINCLFLKKLQQYNEYYLNIIPKNIDDCGKFTCFSLIENMNIFLNDETYPLLMECSSNIIDNWLSPFFFVFEDFNALKIQYDKLLQNVFQHIFLAMETTVIPPTLAQKILSHCSHIPDNFLNPYESPIKSLKYADCYYIGRYHGKYSEYKEVAAGSLADKLCIYHLDVRFNSGTLKNKEIQFNQFANIRKIIK